MPSKRKADTRSPDLPRKRRQSSAETSDKDDEQWEDWPAPATDIELARSFIKECAEERHITLLVPDKDADGLSSGKIMHHMLTSLGLSSDNIKVHMLHKSSSVFQREEQERMESYGATRIIVMDQGSRGGPPLVSPSTKDGKSVRTLILDHHESDEFPESSLVVSACRSPPIATSSLLTYVVCLPLHPSIKRECAIPALLGVFGDLGPSAVKWNQRPWPSSLGEVVKAVSKKAILEAVSAMNAPRRTAEYEVNEAWEAVLRAKTLKDISTNRTFLEARARVNAEVERRTHVKPEFSKDGRVALLRIHSGYQVHPVIATRWAGHLRARNLKLVMVANDGYNPSGQHTNFSCRIVQSLRKLPENERPNLIEILKEFAAKVEDSGFMERVGGDFARGHKEASGGIILSTDFTLFCEAMQIGVKPDTQDLTPKAPRRKVIDPGQRTKLTSFFRPMKDLKQEL